MTTDTPRTDAARERYYDGKTSDWVHYTICGMIERELNASKAEVEKAEEECAKWRKVAESLAHKPKPKLDQRKFAKQDWWDKKLANDK